MAADGSFTQMIFFIASILVAVSVSGVIIGMSDSMAQELKLKANNASTEMATSLEIANDPRHMPYDGYNLTLYLKNTGDIALIYNNIAILIDGQYINDTAAAVENNASMWQPTYLLVVQVRVSLTPGDHDVKVVLPNGVSGAMSFRI